jgi:hypothetical protein
MMGRYMLAKILDHGESTRSLLRFKPLAGSVQRIAARWEVTTGVREGGSRQPLPPAPGIQLILRAEVDRVGSEGEASYRCEIEQVDLLVRDGTPMGVIESLRAELAPLAGLRGAGRVAADGRAIAFGFALPASLPVTLRQPLEDMTAALSGMGNVLPSEAVGLGARWEVDGASFTLKSQSPGEVGVRMALAESDRPVGDSMQARIRARGGTLLALDRLWPTRAELKVDARTRADSGTTGLSAARLQIRELSFTRATNTVRTIAV